jgi:glyoxylase-like metal-dependent hydrolase (beta-lactamase superfamily II)
VSIEYTVISIGALSRNRLWGEAGAARTSHATTTLVRAGDRRILVDPSLPAAALDARYNERTGGRLADVTDVFCTTLRPVHCRAIAALPQANWWADEAEREWRREALREALDSARRLGGDDASVVEAELRVVDRFRPAPEQFVPQVHLYPLRGPTPGGAGLLLTPPTATVLIAGDAVLTAEHVLRGQVWEGCIDAEAALDSLKDALEIADILVPGHDNLLVVPGRWV